MTSEELKKQFDGLSDKEKKKRYELWRDYFPPPCLENCESFLKLLELKPWKNAFIWRPRSKYKIDIVKGI